jgi:dimethylhistidine N-methyltransferase
MSDTFKQPAKRDASQSVVDLSNLVAIEIKTGLLKENASLSPKFFYDTLGSVLFEAICELPEYYPTRTEAEIFSQYLPEMARRIGTGATLIDLGAGNCAKAAKLFPLLHPEQYVPIDISAEHMRDYVKRLQERFPHIEMTPLERDFSAHWQLPEEVRSSKRVFFYPGSSIGNFDPDQALVFLRQMRAACSEDGGILIGVDLIKEFGLLNTAYDDALGVTAAFNLNMLRHVNRIIGADFDVRAWSHKAFFNPTLSRIEMHLEARTDVIVRWSGGMRHFKQGEGIHTENSYKYSVEKMTQFLKTAGFGNARAWTDEKNWFAVIYAEVV